MGHSRSHPIRNVFSAVAIPLALAVAAPASAQVTVEFGRPQAIGFSNNYPWFNDVPQYEGNQSFQYFLAYHPNIARELSRNPGLLYNANWRAQHPELAQYLTNHSYEWQALNNANWSMGPAETPWGYYNNQHQWRDAYWWHQNDPGWFYDNHQSWASLDSRWLDEDGAYDSQRNWHYGEWWYNQNPAWVTANHPIWLREHRNWENQAEQQSFRQQHAMREPNQHYNRAQAAAVRQHTSRDQTQQNHQSAVNQRRANAERQLTTRHDNQLRQQATRQQNQHQRQASRGQLQTPHRQNQQAAHRSHAQQPKAMHEHQIRTSHLQTRRHG